MYSNNAPSKSGETSRPVSNPRPAQSWNCRQCIDERKITGGEGPEALLGMMPVGRQIEQIVH